MRRTALASFAVVLGAIGATAAHAAGPVTVSGLRFPEDAVGYHLNGSVDLERGSPGNGTSLDYSKPDWKLDVFVYDLKRREIPDDPKSAIVRAEFERSRDDVFLAQPRGPYLQVYLRRNFTVDDHSRRTRFQCAAFHMTRDGAKPQDGFLCVTALRNKFVKFRMTTLTRPGTEAEARQQMVQWVPVLWAPGQAAEPEARGRPAPPPRRRPPPQRRVIYR